MQHAETRPDQEGQEPLIIHPEGDKLHALPLLSLAALLLPLLYLLHLWDQTHPQPGTNPIVWLLLIHLSPRALIQFPLVLITSITLTILSNKRREKLPILRALTYLFYTPPLIFYILLNLYALTT